MQFLTPRKEAGGVLSFHQLFPALKQTSDQLQTHTHHTHTHTRARGGRPERPPSRPSRPPPSPRRRRRHQHLGPADSAPPSGAALRFGFPSCILRLPAGLGSRGGGGPIAMEYFMVPAQKVPSLQHFRKTEKEVIGGLCSLANIPLTPETQRDQERRIRREIANSNERRRMQSINAGFQSLKTLIPHTDGEKLSKAAILQQTAEYIFSLEQEKTRLLQQNTQLKRFIQELSGSSPKRRRAEDKDEGIGSPDIWEDEKAEDLRREMIELRQQLDKERSVRMMLEEQVRSLEAHMYPEKLKVIAQQVQLQQQQEQVRLLHQEKLEREQQHLRTQLLPPPAPTHHPTVIVPAPPPPPSHHINVVTMGPSSVINSVSTSRQNLDTIVQAIQHIEGTQDKQELEEEQRRAVIVKPLRSCPEAHTSDTASDSEASDSDAMDQSREEPLGDSELP
ncbi:transcription factor AP-4 isoform X1 [Ochotona princeps]|uniref:transcription factor AP-4 isoform X1 n=1 Tax=Ochotona princeps TaxID=9978 RepID=UPI002714CEF5|nr:transcription factor AP-4 isoform X1 [Ochotona princeps]